jgi:hypothetical protein
VQLDRSREHGRFGVGCVGVVAQRGRDLQAFFHLRSSFSSFFGGKQASITLRTISFCASVIGGILIGGDCHRKGDLIRSDFIGSSNMDFIGLLSFLDRLLHDASAGATGGLFRLGPRDVYRLLDGYVLGDRLGDRRRLLGHDHKKRRIAAPLLLLWFI